MNKHETNVLANQNIHYETLSKRYQHFKIDMDRLEHSLKMVAFNSKNQNKFIMKNKIILSHLTPNRICSTFTRLDQQTKFRMHQGVLGIGGASVAKSTGGAKR